MDKGEETGCSPVIAMTGYFLSKKEQEIMKCSIGAMVLVLVFAYTVHADEGAVRLGELVVTPLRYEQDINQCTSDVTVITRGQIDESPAKNVTEALQTTPGLVVTDLLGNGVRPTVSLRGFGAVSYTHLTLPTKRIV